MQPADIIEFDQFRAMGRGLLMESLSMHSQGNAMDDIHRLPPVFVVSATSADSDHRLRSATIACRQAGRGAVAFSSHWGKIGRASCRERGWKGVGRGAG